MKKAAAIALSALFAVPMFCAPREMTFADGFNGASWVETIEQNISFSYKDDEETIMQGGLPQYCNVGNYLNTCAPVAGSIILGFYDQYFDNLIENFTSTREIFGITIYSGQTQAVQDTIDQLYVDMETNSMEGGTTINGFKTGLQTYVERQGQDVSYSQRVSNQNVNLTAIQQSVQNRKPVVLFVSHYTLVDRKDLDATTGTEDVFLQHYGGNHTLVAYGTRTVKYYNAAGNLVQELNLIAVATGYVYYPLAYIILDDYTNVIDGFEVNIY